MNFYRNLLPFKVISFDLDDTLYDNSAVILSAEARFIAYLQKLALPQIDPLYWRAWKLKERQKNPLLYEDTTLWRASSLRSLLQFHGQKDAAIEKTVENCMHFFMQCRHEITVSLKHQHLLDELKKRFPLVAISNGNVDPNRIHLSQFALVLRAGQHGRAKPHSDLFLKTLAFFAIKPHELIHIGDDLITDVQGAVAAGCQAIWLNNSFNTIRNSPTATLLPNIEIKQLDELITFFDIPPATLDNNG